MTNEKALKEKVSQYLKRFARILAVNAFTIFTVCFFSSLEVFLGNIIDFYFDVGSLWWIIFAFSASLSLISAAVEALIPQKVTGVFNAIAFSLGLCFYVQAMFLNGHMDKMTHKASAYPKGLIASNLIIWLAVFAAVIGLLVFLSRKGKRKEFANGILFISLALIVVQLTGLLSLVVKYDPASEEFMDLYLSSSGSLELSEENNVLYFVLDTCDNRHVDIALEKEPDLFDEFTGFTNYRNAVSTYSRTYPSIPYMLTGKNCYFNMSSADYINAAFKNSSFFSEMDKLNTDIRLYTDTQYVSHNVFGTVDNCLPNDGNMKVSPFGFLKQSIKVAAYKSLPYIVKARFEYSSYVVNSRVVQYTQNNSWGRDINVYTGLNTEGISLSAGKTPAFRFYHFMGSHPSPLFNENMEYSSDSDPIDALRGDFHILQEYIRQLKNAGIYDKTTIIITADHGKTAAADYYRRYDAAACIMLYKPAGADSSLPMVTSYAPVGHDDLFATIIDALGGDGSAFGSTLEEIGESEDRTRYYYFTAMEVDGDSEVALREYAIEGDANNFDNWNLTGRNWNIEFSERDVSNISICDIEDVEISEIPDDGSEN